MSLKLEVGIKYTAVAQSMEIWIFKATNLRNVLHNDPYVQVTVTVGAQKVLEGETPYQSRNLNPQWNQKFQLDNIAKKALTDMSIEFNVIDHNTLRKHFILGKVCLSSLAYGSCGKQWKLMLENDDKLITKSHPIIKY